MIRNRMNINQQIKLQQQNLTTAYGSHVAHVDVRIT